MKSFSASLFVLTALSGCFRPVAECESEGDLSDGGAPSDGGTPASCADVLASNPAAPDGVYRIWPVGSAAIDVQCLMSVDDGGWTLVSNFPWQGNTQGVPGWNDGAQVGPSFTDNSVPWKMSDALINTIKTTGYRALGTATQCLQGPCSVKTTLYWKATCNYNSGALNPGCGTAFLDPDFTVRPSGSPSEGTACAWHFGLVSAICTVTSDLGTSHQGNHEFVGIPGTYVHAFDGRPGENPSIQVWAR